MSPINEKIDIEVYGRKLSVEFEDIEPLEVQALARDLTEKMERIASESQIVNSSTLAVQAALQTLAEMSLAKTAFDNDRAADNRLLQQTIYALKATLAAAPEPKR